MADNVNIIVQDTINDIVVNAAVVVETIDINVQAAVDVVDIVANPNNYVVNINRIIGEQVQSDWTQTDNQAPDYIKNKPSIPTATSDLTNDGADGVHPFITAADITAQVNSDWNATSGVAEILNKPTIPTNTSDLVNDGENGVDPFITAADVPNFTSVVKHIVKNNGLSGTITKGTAIYVTSSNGTNMLVGRASNASEATSSKTMGLMESDITTTGANQTGYVVTEGLLEGLNTATATAGDPVWLGVNGALIYGLTNKPYAPAHLVFIGIVTKVSAGNGEIFVKVQNGFELKEIHDVDLITTTPINGHLLGFDGTLWVNKTIASWLGFTPVTDARTISTTAPLSGGGDLSANRTLSISQASTSTNGYLSSTDWNTFNNKFTLPALTSGSVLFSNGTTIAQDNSNLFWDDTNNRLGIGTNAPNSTFHLASSITAASAIARGGNITSTLVAAANSDVLIGLDIAPTFTNGAFTGIGNLNIRASGWIQSNGGFAVSSTAYSGGIPINGLTITGAAPAKYFVGSGSGFSHSFRTGSNDTTGERLRITDSNVMALNTNMLINTTTDAGYKLDVNGTARATALTLTGDGSGVGIYFGNSGTSGRISIDGAFTRWKSQSQADMINVSNNFVGIMETSVVSSAVLSVASTTRGFLPPRMTTTQKNAIATPAAGLIVYDTTLGKLCVRTALAWETITSI